MQKPSVISEQELSSVAKIHYLALKDDILPSLGQRYLTIFYKYLNKSKYEEILVIRNDINDIVSVLVVSFKVNTLLPRTIMNTFCSFVFYSIKNIFISSRFRKLSYQVLKGVLFNKERPEELIPEIAFIFTDPNSQNQGLGSKVLQSGETFLRENGYSQLFVKTIQGDDNKAVGFYLNNGYETIGFSKFAGNKYHILKKDLMHE